MARTKRKVNPVLPQAEQPKQEQKVYRTAAYVRLSIADSGKSGSDTIEGQKRLLTCYIESTPDLELYRLYCDNGHTGTDFERPAFEQLMEDVKRGAVDCIVVKDLSRFGRNYIETGNYLERIFPFLGVRFIAINDNFDTLTAQCGADGYIMPLKNLINETYSRDISHKVSSAIESKEKHGEFIGVWAPYGYSKSKPDRHRLEINEDTSPIVREIFRLRTTGMGYSKIARKLNESSILSPSAYLYQNGFTKNEKYRDTLWTTWNIKEILRGEVYIGHLVQGKRTQRSYKEARKERYAPSDEWRIVRNAHEAIIDEHTFQAVQELAGERAEAYHASLGTNGSIKTDNMFRGLVYCADCGKALSRRQLSSNWHKEKEFYYSFICLTALNKPSACSRKNLMERELFEVVSDSLRCHLEIVAELEDRIKTIWEAKVADSKHSLDLQIEAVERELTRNRALHDGLYQSLVDGIMTRQEYTAMKENYGALCRGSEERLETLKCQRNEQERFSPLNPMFTALRKFQGVEGLSEELIHALIARIEFGGGNRLNIMFTYQDEFEALKRFASEVTAV